MFILRRELVSMCLRAHIITGVLQFRKKLSQDITRVGRDGPTLQAESERLRYVHYERRILRKL